jgi:hypothetical protein
LMVLGWFLSERRQYESRPLGQSNPDRLFQDFLAFVRCCFIIVCAAGRIRFARLLALGTNPSRG